MNHHHLHIVLAQTRASDLREAAAGARPARVTGATRVTRRVASGAALSAIIGAIVLAGPSDSLAIPGEDSEPSVDVYSETIPLHHAPDHWVKSPDTWQEGPDCHTKAISKMIGSLVAFEPTDFGGVRPGDVFRAQVSVGVRGTCGGGAQVKMGLRLPPNTSFAVDTTNKIRCLLFPNGSKVATDVTNDPAAECPAAPALTLEGGSLGKRTVANVSTFVIDVPLRATGPVRGGLLVAEVESDQVVEPQGPAYPAVTLTEPTLPSGALSALLACVWDNPKNPGPC